MTETITLRCKSCGETVVRNKHCAYTGIEHGRGWVYVCGVCRGDMEVLGDLVKVLVEAGKILDDMCVPEHKRYFKLKVGKTVKAFSFQGTDLHGRTISFGE